MVAQQFVGNKLREFITFTRDLITGHMRINKYLPFAILYFFINSVALPLGLTYTALLAPFFYGWILIKRKKEILLPFLAIMTPFIIGQVFISGVDLTSYVVSFLNIILVYIFCQAVYTFLITVSDHEWIFRKLLILNTVLCLFAVILYFTPWADLFWIRQTLTEGVDRFYRMKLFTYEASYYAHLFVPLFFFFLFQYFLRKNNINNTLLIMMITVPLILSFSIGVIGCLLAALMLTILIHFRTLVLKRRVVNTFISLGVITCVLVFIAFFFFRDNPLFTRIANILSGQDTSGMGRTTDAYYLANRILQEKNIYWGIGPGQLKMIGEETIRGFYLYYHLTPVAIPNVTAETLLVFGWVGVGLRFFIELFLFFHTKVWSNYYRLALFLFIFFYQFSGSFLTNVAEYVIWIMAFTPVFKEFDVKVPGQPRYSGLSLHVHKTDIVQS